MNSRVLTKASQGYTAVDMGKLASNTNTHTSTESRANPFQSGSTIVLFDTYFLLRGASKKLSFNYILTYFWSPKTNTTTISPR